MFGELLAIAIALIAYAIHKFTTGHARYFEERNLKYGSAASGLTAILNMFFSRSNILEITQGMYNTFPDEP